MQKLPKLLVMAAAAVQLLCGAAGVHAAETTILNVNQSMVPDKHYFSPNGAYFAVFQGFDGNLVIYKGPDRTAAGVIWAAGAKYGTQAIFQYDTNFVIYKGATVPSNAVWASGTDTGTNSGGRLALSDEGRLIVYNGSGTAKWSVGVNPPTTTPPPCMKTTWSACVGYGTTKYNSVVWACTWADAQWEAQLAGGYLGVCR